MVVENADQPFLTHSRLMGQRLYLHTYLRLAVAVAIAIGAFVGKHVVGIEELAVTPLLVLAAVIASYNAITYFVTRAQRFGELDREAHRRLLNVMYAAIVLDYLALAAAIWIVGGVRSPFVAFFVLHLILSCMYLSTKAAVLSTALAYGLLVLLALSEVYGVVVPHLPIGSVSSKEPLDARHAVTVLVVYGLLFVMTLYLLTTLSRLLRRGERELRRTHEEVTRLSNQRRDFLHIAVHNLRSPIGVTTMFVEHLRAGLGGPITEQQQKWLDTCLRRLDGLQVFLQDLQLLSTFEAGELETKKTDVDMVALLRQIEEEHRELAARNHHELTLTIPEELRPVRGIERLLREAVINYVTNAIKYTPDGGHIEIRAAHEGSVLRIEVEDDGIGIADSDRERLFSEFFRGRREDTPVAGVEGTGLGLSIVKRIAAVHGGRIDVRSEVDRGSTFILELPLGGSA